MIRRITIGAAPSNDIQFHGRFIENFHAEIHVFEDNTLLVDKSKNFGVTVNGDRIQGEHVLQPNDHVKISTHVLHWKDAIQDVLEPKESEYYPFYIKDFLRLKGRVDPKSYRMILGLFLVSPIFIFFFAGPAIRFVHFLSNYISYFMINGPIIKEPVDEFVYSWDVPLMTALSLVVLYSFIAQTLKRIRDHRLRKAESKEV